VLMDQSLKDNTFAGAGPPTVSPGHAVSCQSPKDKRRKRSPGVPDDERRWCHQRRGRRFQLVIARKADGTVRQHRQESRIKWVSGNGAKANVTETADLCLVVAVVGDARMAV